MHADDFGFNRDTAKTTIDLFEKGYLSSASIMVNCDASDIAIDFAKKHPEFSYGVHLTFVDEIPPVCRKSNISSILKNGRFFNTKEFIMRALLGNLKINDIKNEMTSQISRLYDSGVIVSHVDSHGSVHKLPVFQKAMEEVLPRFGITRARRVQNIFMQYKRERFLTAMLNSFIQKQISKMFATPNYLYIPAHRFDREWSDFLISQMNKLPENSTLEIVTHPGTEEDYRTFECKDIIDFNGKIDNKKHRMVTYRNI